MMTVVNAGSLFPEKPLIKGYAYFKTTNLQECLYLGTYNTCLGNIKFLKHFITIKLEDPKCL